MTRPLRLKLDRSSPTPLYFQAARELERAIETGVLDAGQRLNNEVDLANQLGLSRPTLRRAIQELVDKGLLVRKRGVGTQVVHGHVKRSVALTSLYDDLSTSGAEPSTKVLLHELTPASAPVAEALAMTAGDEVVHLERLRFTRGEPLAILRNWLPPSLVTFTADDLADEGLYELLRNSGVHMRIARQRIGARAASTRESRLLNERRNACLLTMERVTYNDTGRAIEFGTHVYRAETYSFETTLINR
ncbi:myo-inositol degradation transcriptional regulator [Rugosimonospora acidiphila]|uniref:Myo-inositol degradation transcriptional regulator n=1 Tax=Rugosimonospora acidiphila TaxID=556531 RepID=A0ABP9RSJ4_9ACTN